MNSPKNYYTILGVSSNATQDEIKKAYRKLAQKYHPDVSKEASAEAMMKSVNEAYEVLGNPEKRAHYDRFGTQQSSTGNPYGPYTQNTTGYTTFDDLFREILRQQQRQQQNQQQYYNQQQTGYQRPRVVRFSFFHILFGFWLLRSILEFIFAVFASFFR